LRKIISALLILALVFSLCALTACGDGDSKAYRVIETIGTKEYGSVCRYGDKAAAVVDAAMQVLSANGTLSSISVDWLGEDLISIEGDAEALVKLGETLEEPIAPRKLIVGVEADMKPISFTEAGTTVGMSPAIAYAIGDLVGWEIQIIPISDGEVGTHLSAGNIDCAMGFGTENINAEKYSVGLSYMESEIALAVYSDSEVKKIKDLKEQRVGTICDPSVQSAILANEKLTKYASGATVYLSTTRCMNALEKGWCGAVALDSLLLSRYFN